MEIASPTLRSLLNSVCARSNSSPISPSELMHFLVFVGIGSSPRCYGPTTAVAPTAILARLAGKPPPQGADRNKRLHGFSRKIAITPSSRQTDAPPSWQIWNAAWPTTQRPTDGGVSWSGKK